MISAKMLAHSKNPLGQEIATMIVTFPRYILAEFNTHRMFSRNSASSRAIPFNKMVKMVEENPFIPIAWQKDHKGMQGTEYLDDVRGDEIDDDFTDDFTGRDLLNGIWAEGTMNLLERPDGTAMYHAIECAKELNKYGATKQIANRLLEPFMWHTVLVTSTEWENFFNLRCPQYELPIHPTEVFKSRKEAIKRHNYPELHNRDNLFWLSHNKGQADIHMMALAEAMYDCLKESTPKELQAGQWHIPFGDNIEVGQLGVIREHYETGNPWMVHPDELIRMIATARCARTSYNDFEGASNNYVKDIELHDRLLKSGHWSPFEHCARAMSNTEYANSLRTTLLRNDEESNVVEKGWCRNFRGFVQYRAMVDHQ